ncbi:hypothetical protein [Haloferax sp. ATB1]|uniref:hypothetical protein n=1 Tax=Haloferax sp. ATB1 TaxID=1508454 RepID=UPI0018E2FAAC|nr:hypothetical protein [Haloferax sp. ATB1]
MSAMKISVESGTPSASHLLLMLSNGPMSGPTTWNTRDEHHHDGPLHRPEDVTATDLDT